MKTLMLASIAALALASPAVSGQDDGNVIVVTAQRSGAPMWTLETDTGTVLLVGEIAAVPEATPWRPESLEEATAGAQRVILGVKGKVSPGDIFRVIFAGGKIRNLPRETAAADYLTPAMLERLRALEQVHDQDYSRKSFLMTSFDLLAQRLRFTRGTGPDASDVVRRAARKADVPAEPVGTVRGEDMLDSLAQADPRSHLGCLEAAMTAAETGSQIVADRGADWRASDIPAVMANPLEIALGRCWPWADAELGSGLRDQWISAITRAAGESGVTLAVVPLRVLAEDGGVLDRLEAQGMALSGPAWR